MEQSYAPDDIWREKADEIYHVLSAERVDLWKLRELALSPGGLVNDSLRRKAWPKLTGVHPRELFSTPHRTSLSSNPQSPSAAELSPLKTFETPVKETSQRRRPSPAHKQPFVTNQSLLRESKNTRRYKTTTPQKTPTPIATSVDHTHVGLDATRCTWHLLTGSERLQRLQIQHKRQRSVARHIRRKQDRLANLLNAVLVQTNLRYYQGFHDIACIFLSVLEHKVPKSLSNAEDLSTRLHQAGLALPCAVLGQVSQTHLRTYLQASFEPLKTVLHLTVLPLLASVDPELHDHLYTADVTPMFLLPWIIAWFAHDIRDSVLVRRIFDAFLVGHPLLPIYTSIAMLQANRRDILDTNPDFASLHHILAQLPRNSSLVGWKYQAGTGYVSDHESTSEAPRIRDRNEIPLSTISVTYEEDDYLCLETTSYTSALTGFTYGESLVKVPWDDLLESALSLMERVPPKDVLQYLAPRYHGKQAVEELLTPSLAALFEAPANIPASAPADWWVREQARQGGSTVVSIPAENRNRASSRAAAAMGCAIGSRTKRLRRRRNRRIVGALILASVLAAVMMVKPDFSWVERVVEQTFMEYAPSPVVMEDKVDRKQQDSAKRNVWKEEPASLSMKNPDPVEADVKVRSDLSRLRVPVPPAEDRQEQLERSLRLEALEKERLEQKRKREEAARAEREARAERLLLAKIAKEEELAEKQRRREEARLERELEAELKAEQTRLENERAAREKAAREEKARQAAEHARLERERLAEQARIEKEQKAELARLERELQIEQARMEEEAKARAIAEREERAKIEAEQARLERERKAELARIEKEKKAEEERLEKERMAEEARLEREKKAEKARLEKEQQAAQVRIEKEQKIELARLERELKLEQARMAKERKAREKAEYEERATKMAAQAKLEKERMVERERVERERKAEQARMEQERKDELERLEKELKLEQSRLEKEDRAREKAEKLARAKQESELARLEKEKKAKQLRFEKQQKKEQARLAKEEKAEQARLKKELKIEQARLEKQEKVEEARSRKERARLEKEERAELARAEKERKIEQVRLEKEEKVERARAEKKRRVDELALEKEEAKREKELKALEKAGRAKQKAERAKKARAERTASRQQPSGITLRNHNAPTPFAAKVGAQSSPLQFLNYFKNGLVEFRDSLRDASAPRLIRILAIVGLDIMLLVAFASM